MDTTSLSAYLMENCLVFLSIFQTQSFNISTSLNITSKRGLSWLSHLKPFILYHSTLFPSEPLAHYLFNVCLLHQPASPMRTGTIYLFINGGQISATVSQKTQSTQYMCVELINEIWDIYVLRQGQTLQGKQVIHTIPPDGAYNSTPQFWETYIFMELTIYLGNKIHCTKGMVHITST